MKELYTTKDLKDKSMKEEEYSFVLKSIPTWHEWRGTIVKISGKKKGQISLMEFYVSSEELRYSSTAKHLDKVYGFSLHTGLFNKNNAPVEGDQVILRYRIKAKGYNLYSDSKIIRVIGNGTRKD